MTFYSHACEISREDEISHASEIPHVSDIFCHRNYLLPIIRIYHIIREQRLVKKTFRGAYLSCRSCSVSNSFEFQQVQSIDMKKKTKKKHVIEIVSYPDPP